MAKAQDIRIAWITTGLTGWDVAGRLVGAADLPWCPEGERMALDAAAALGPGELAVVLHAPDEASEQTARAFCASTGAKPKPVDELAEVGLGLWEGMLATDAEEKFTSSYRAWLDDPSSVTPPGGESLADAQDRLLAALSRHLMKSKADHVGVVLRPMAMGLVRCWRRGLPLAQTRKVAGCPSVEWDTLSRNALRREAAG